MMKWEVRTSASQFYGLEPNEIYIDDSILFTLKIFHGGEFQYGPEMVYVGGKENFIDLVEIDKLSMYEIDAMVVDIGYDESDPHMLYHYRVPGMDLRHGLKLLGTQFDILQMIRHAKKHKVIEMYIEHGETLKEPFQPNDPIDAVIPPNEQTDQPVAPNEPTKKPLLPPNDPTEPIEHISPYHPIIDFSDDPFQEPTLAPNCPIHESNTHTVNPIKVVLLEYGYTDAEIYAFEQACMDTNGGCMEDERNKDSQNGGAKNDENENYIGNDHIVDTENEYDGDGDHDSMDSLEDSDDNASEDSEVEEEQGNEHQTNISPLEYVVPSENERREEKVVGLNGRRYSYVDSENGDSDELYSVASSDEEVDRRGNKAKAKRSYPVFNTDKDNIDIEWKMGEVFGSKKDVKRKLREYAIKTRRRVLPKKDDKVRFRVVCKGSPKCPWVLLVSLVGRQNIWQVKTLKDVHTCPTYLTTSYITGKWVAKNYLSKFKDDPNTPVEALRSQVRTDLTLEITRHQALRARRIALRMIYGNYKQQFSDLWDYAAELHRSNPNSTVKIDLEPANPGEEGRVFRRIYVCLGALKAGFKAGCRNFLGFDGCFLKGPFPGEILTVVATDANNGMYPVAYAVVEKECKDSWTWFLENVVEDLGINNQHQWSFISDQQKGLVPAMREFFPEIEHRFCLMHIYNNYKKQFKGTDLKNKLFNAARSTNVRYFERAMKELKEADHGAFLYASSKPPNHWSKSHFTTYVKCDMLMNNICESLNGKIVNARDKPIITMLEAIRNYLMKRIQKKRIEISKWDGPICPRIQDKMEKLKSKALSKYTCIWNGGHHYQLTGVWGDQYVVDLDRSTCSCRLWDVSGIPCMHAIHAIVVLGSNGGNGIPEEWANNCYSVVTQKKIYEHTIFPINGVNLWQHQEGLNVIKNPKFKKGAGRPRKLRRKDPDELKKHVATQEVVEDPYRLPRTGREMTCSRCGNANHNLRSCRGQGCPPRPRRKRTDSQEDEEPHNVDIQGENSQTNRERGRGQGRGRGRGRGQGRGRGRVATSSSRVYASQGGWDADQESIATRGRGRGRGRLQSNASQDQFN